MGIIRPDDFYTVCEQLADLTYGKQDRETGFTVDCWFFASQVQRALGGTGVINPWFDCSPENLMGQDLPPFEELGVGQVVPLRMKTIRSPRRQQRVFSHMGVVHSPGPDGKIIHLSECTRGGKPIIEHIQQLRKRMIVIYNQNASRFTADGGGRYNCMDPAH